MYEIVRFRHQQTGEIRAGLHTRDFAEHDAIGVYVPGHREIVVHRANVLERIADAT